MQKVPYVYALTSEMDDDVVEKIKAAGFKKIYHMLDQTMIKEIKRNAGIKFGSVDVQLINQDKNSIVWRLRGHSKELN